MQSRNVLRLMAALAVTAAGAGRAEKSACELPDGATMRIVEYFKGPPTRDGDHKCTGTRCSLKGWLYVPKVTVPGNKAMVFLHGHARDRREPCQLAANFLSSGYVVFAPVRSGNTGADDTQPGNKLAFTNTGLYIDDWVKKQGESCEPGHVTGGCESKRVVFLRDFAVHDVDHALQFLVANHLAGEGRIGIIGHSFGGALAVLSSEGTFAHNPKAIADVQGAELSWGDGDGEPWKGPLVGAVRRRHVPIYFLQPRNGASIAPTIVLSHEAAVSGNNEFQAALFLPVVPNTGPDDVHGKFISTRVPEWGDSVRDFFERYFDR